MMIAPLAIERLTINKVEKLIRNLNDKKKHVLHYENLKLYESLGLKITKIHRGNKFEEYMAKDIYRPKYNSKSQSYK